MLRELHLRDVGPAPAFDVEFAERLNIFTGDNGLGKTFLLDCTWWALTGSWPGPIALPHRGSTAAKIGYFYNAEDSGSQVVDGPYPVPYDLYDYRTQTWPRATHESAHPAVYVRTDGGISVFEPNHYEPRYKLSDSRFVPGEPSIHFDSRTIWYGIERGEHVVCNGLIQDLVLWQFSPEREKADSPFGMFERVLRRLTPDSEPVEFLMPSRIYLNDARQYPTLKTSHGDLPIHLAPAGLKRILGLAYLMVWAWNEHRSLSALTNSKPADHLDVLIDEVELHLHPKWQRSILPSLLKVGDDLDSGKATQLFVTTHAPLVLASIEPMFDEEQDRLFLFDHDEETNKVELKELPWAKQGDADNWLTSQVFGLSQARSIEAERAILAANAFMRGDKAALPEDLRTEDQIHEELKRVLAGVDKFWRRWPRDREDAA